MKKRMRILHTEASNGWGGQEMRILKEALGLRERGHEIFFCVTSGGVLATKARDKGFKVYELPLVKKKVLSVLFHLRRLIKNEKIEIVNTHSSIDAWLGGVAAKFSGSKIVRTRHLSSTIRSGLNSKLLYRFLADRVVTTCAAIVPVIQKQASLIEGRCLSIPTGVDPKQMQVKDEDLDQFKKKWGILPTDFVAGTVCILRSWKGVPDLLQAAHILKKEPHLKWLIVGGGPGEKIFREEAKRLQIEDRVIFTGYVEQPQIALSSMNCFLLLSTKNEGVSQASLQAGYLGKPLITTRVGGLPEVCLDTATGFQVDIENPEQVSQGIQRFLKDETLVKAMGDRARRLVIEKFTYEKMLDQMEDLFYSVLS